MKKFLKKIYHISLDQWFLVGYLVVISALIFFKYYRVSIDIVFVIFLAATIFSGRTKQYVKDWLPFVILFLSYELMRGIADNLNERVHIESLIMADRTLFGGIVPTIWLQEWLYKGTLGFIEYLAIFFYTSHFYLSFIAAFIMWLIRPALFRIFAKGFILLTFAGFLTYILYPAMPPWLANEQGYLPGVHRILVEDAKDYSEIGDKEPLVMFFAVINSGPNKVAAMPSLHCAWPFFTFLFLIYFLGWRWWPAIILPVGVWLSVIYLGEHYVIDVLMGIIYAAVAFGLTKKYFALSIYNSRHNDIALGYEK